MAVVFLITALNLRSEGGRSAYTQAHGAARQATIITVQNIMHQSHSHHGGTHTWYTAQMTVSVSPPVGGFSQTTVQVPRAVSYVSGQTVGVLVDPRQPGYAELPGVPDVTSGQWYTPLIGALLAAVIACFTGWRAVKKVLGRRRQAELY